MPRRHFLVLALSALGAKGANVGDLEARLLAKRAAIEAKLAIAQAALDKGKFSKVVRSENGTELGEFRYPPTGSSGLEVHPADAVLAFAEERGLPAHLRRDLSEEACSALPDKCGDRTRAIVATLPVTLGDTEEDNIGTIELLDGEEAADAAYGFTSEKGLPAEATTQVPIRYFDLPFTVWSNVCILWQL